MKKLLKPFILCILILCALYFLCGCNNQKNQLIATDTQLIEEESQSTPGELNAYQTAEMYLNSMGFSKNGLMAQLAYEGFTAEEIDYAIGHLSADYKNECLETARTYLNIDYFSEAGLKKQLELEGYYSDEINFALENVEVDYNEQAVKNANKYLTATGNARKGLYEYLTIEGFTPEQIDYALKHVNY